jgi:CDP-diacylglycerol--serine O-phosphatidyltransferase
MNKKIIGFYDYTVILTYAGFVSSILGIFYAIKNNFYATVICMGISLICDTLDGKVARHKANRTEKESLFGVQIDSLCDIVSFGILPAVLFFKLGVNGTLDFVLIALYCLCSVIRLGFFNVLAMDKDHEKDIYHGLPVVTLSIFVPLVLIVRKLWLPARVFTWVLRAMLLAFAGLYVLDFKFRKPKILLLSVLFFIFWIPVVLLFVL